MSNTKQSLPRVGSKINDLDQTLNNLFDPTANLSNQADILSAEKLEKLRRSVPLKIDAQGQWWHNQEAFTHPRLIHVFNRGLDMMNGESIVRWAGRWCYIACEVTPFLILKLQVVHTEENTNEPPLHALLNNGECLPLAQLSVHDDILFAQLGEHRYARFSKVAQAQCIPWLYETVDASGFELRYNRFTWPITS